MEGDMVHEGPTEGKNVVVACLLQGHVDKEFSILSHNIDGPSLCQMSHFL